MWTPGRAGIPGQWGHACRSPEVALACKSEEWQGEQQGWSMKGRLGSAGGKQERQLSEKTVRIDCSKIKFTRLNHSR